MSQAPSFAVLLGWFLGTIAATSVYVSLREMWSRRHTWRDDRRQDATGADLLAWNVVHEGRAMRAARLRGDITEELPRFDPDRTQPLPQITPSPLVRPIGPGWKTPAPMPLRPVGPEPGTITRELARLVDEENAAVIR